VLVAIADGVLGLRLAEDEAQARVRDGEDLCDLG
jgi:hypothetical protein